MLAGHLCLFVCLFFERCLFKSLAYFKFFFFCHFVLSSKSYLYILDARLLSDS